MRISFRHRLPWGILFSLMAAAAMWGMPKILYTEPLDFFDCTLSASGDKLNVEHAWYTSSTVDEQEWGWVQHFGIDLETGQIEPWALEQSICQMLQRSPPPLQKAKGDLNSFRYPVLLRHVNWASDRQWNLALVGQRYFVGQHSGKFRYVDLRDGKLTRKEFDSPGSGGMLQQIPGTRNFVCVHAGTTGNSRATSTFGSRVDLIKINDQGDLEFVANWLAYPGRTECGIVNGQIATLNNLGTAIEYHAVDDGHLLQTLEMPQSFNARTQSWYFDWGLFAAPISQDETLYLDLKSKRRLPAPSPPLTLDTTSFDSGMSLLNYVDQNLGQGKLIDSDTGAHVMDYAFHKHVPVVLGKDRLLLPSHAYGFSAEIVEIPTGKRLHRLVPLWWVPWFLGLLIVTYMIAAMGWLRGSLADGGWAWLDVVVLGGVPLSLFSMRLLIGQTFQYYRDSNLYSNGISVAALIMPLIWLVLGKPRLSLRLLPLLLTISFVVVARYSVLVERPVVVWLNLNEILVPATYAILICLVARLLGLEFIQQGATFTEEPCDDADLTSRRTIPLRDLLMLVACIAVLFATLAPLVPTMMSLGGADWLNLRTAKGVLAILLVAAATLAPGRWLFVPACLFAGGMFAVLVTCELSLFISDNDLPWIPAYNLVSLGYTLSAAVVAMFVFLLPYRFRGWRIRRPG